MTIWRITPCWTWAGSVRYSPPTGPLLPLRRHLHPPVSHDAKGKVMQRNVSVGSEGSVGENVNGKRNASAVIRNVEDSKKAVEVGPVSCWAA